MKERLEDGTVVFDDGSRLLSDGTRILADGTRIQADGVVVDANGNIIGTVGSNGLSLEEMLARARNEPFSAAWRRPSDGALLRSTGHAGSRHGSISGMRPGSEARWAGFSFLLTVTISVLFYLYILLLNPHFKIDQITSSLLSLHPQPLHICTLLP